MKTIAIIQARMGSSRLPGKVMQDICGQPMLMWVVKRARMARTIEKVVVAATNNEEDKIIETFCNMNKITCFRGSSEDVLDRFYQAACFFQADVIVRLTSDCPFIDPDLIDETVHAFLDSKVDFAANRLPPPFTRTYPIGLDVEVVSMSALRCAWKEAVQLHEREHVLPYLYEVPGRFNILTLDLPQDLSSLRWTVDTPQDLEFIRQVADRLKCRFDFSWRDVLQVLQLHPELKEINALIKHKTYKDVDDRVSGKKKK